MTFSLEKSICITNIQMPFQNDLYIKLQHLETRIKTFDLEEMDFEVPKIKIKGLKPPNKV
jgi:hypothetical protein